MKRDFRHIPEFSEIFVLLSFNFNFFCPAALSSSIPHIISTPPFPLLSSPPGHLRPPLPPAHRGLVFGLCFPPGFAFLPGSSPRPALLPARLFFPPGSSPRPALLPARLRSPPGSAPCPAPLLARLFASRLFFSPGSAPPRLSCAPPAFSGCFLVLLGSFSVVLWPSLLVPRSSSASFSSSSGFPWLFLGPPRLLCRRPPVFSGRFSVVLGSFAGFLRLLPSLGFSVVLPGSLRLLRCLYRVSSSSSLGPSGFRRCLPRVFSSFSSGPSGFSGAFLGFFRPPSRVPPASPVSFSGFASSFLVSLRFLRCLPRVSPPGSSCPFSFSGAFLGFRRLVLRLPPAPSQVFLVPLLRFSGFRSCTSAFVFVFCGSVFVLARWLAPFLIYQVQDSRAVRFSLPYIRS